MKKFICLIIVLLLTVVTGCTTFSDAGVVNLEITKNNVEVEELDVRIGDTFQLGTKANNDLSANVIWESSNPEVVSIDENGNVVVLQKGPAVVTATVQGKPYITDSIFVDSAAPVEQLGVGSGLTPEELRDETLLAACRKYKELQDASSVVGKMVETYTNKLHEMRIFIESIDFNEIDFDYQGYYEHRQCQDNNAYQ